MVAEKKKTVWVLGSGFPRSLGGPLLRDLLSDKGHHESNATFPHLPKRRAVYEVFAARRSTRDKSGAWEDAEQFLDFVDTARREGSPRAQLLKTFLGSAGHGAIPLEELHSLALLSVAAECSTYTVNADLESEGWTPYKAWANAVLPGDSILTFNYDTVVELLAEHVKGARMKRGGEVQWSDPVKRPHAPCDGMSGAGFPAVYKLHGSVGWNRIGESHDLFTTGPWRQNFQFTRDVPLIAGPGPDKKIQCQGPFRGIWDEAKLALETAHAVVFLGYRFPPSDSEARSTLLGSLQANSQRTLTLHTVLGPDLGHPDNVRLEALLRGVMRSRFRHELGTAEGDLGAYADTDPEPKSFRMVRHPMWVEDFLSLPGTWHLHS